MTENAQRWKQDALHNPRFPRSNRYDPNWIMANEMGPNVLWLTESITQRMDFRRQMRVLEGSRVELSVECVNNKDLQSAWAVVNRDGEEPLRLELTGEGQRWRLDPTGTPLEEVRQRIQFAVQVRDTDGLQLPSSVTGND